MPWFSKFVTCCRFLQALQDLHRVVPARPVLLTWARVSHLHWCMLNHQVAMRRPIPRSGAAAMCLSTCPCATPRGLKSSKPNTQLLTHRPCVCSAASGRGCGSDGRRPSGRPGDRCRAPLMFTSPCPPPKGKIRASINMRIQGKPPLQKPVGLLIDVFSSTVHLMHRVTCASSMTQLCGMEVIMIMTLEHTCTSGYVGIAAVYTSAAVVAALLLSHRTGMQLPTCSSFPMLAQLCRSQSCPNPGGAWVVKSKGTRVCLCLCDLD